jgi:hypothetical protein
MHIIDLAECVRRCIWLLLCVHSYAFMCIHGPSCVFMWQEVQHPSTAGLPVAYNRAAASVFNTGQAQWPRLQGAPLSVAAMNRWQYV